MSGTGKMIGCLHRNALLFASLSFGINLMHSIFNFYYVKIFLDHYHVSQSWFQVAQTLYLIWNAVNDPLFAYWQDNSKIEIFRSRRLNVLYGAPLFSLSFLIAWFPWGDYTNRPWLAGIHLLVALSCYDAMFTYVGLAWCALFTEISQKHEDRIRLTKYAQVASIFGSSSVFFSQIFCDGLDNMKNFHIYVVVLCLISWGALFCTGKYVRTAAEYDRTPVPEDIQSPSIPSKEPLLDEASVHDADEPSASSTAFTQFKQICIEKNFVIFVTTNFMQCFQSTYLSNFLSIFGDELIPEQVLPQIFRKLLYGSAFVIPQILVLCLSPLVGSKGYYCVSLWSFYFKVICAVVVFLAGRQYPILLAFFFLVDMSATFAIGNFFDLPMSDLVDADQKRHSRRLPLSSSVFAYNALVTKPAQSLAPMLIVAVLNRNHYQDKLAGDMSTSEQQELQSAMFLVACAIPFVIGLLQILVWWPYSIRDSHITIAKHVEM